MCLRLESVAIQNQKKNKLLVHNNLHIKKDFGGATKVQG